VEGVGQAKVLPLWAGPGTVKVIIIDADNKTASSELVQAAYEHIESNRPIGATVTVTSPAPFPVDISATIDGSVDAEAVRADVNAFFRANGFDLKKVTLARIGKILMDTGLVNDYENLTLNGQSASVHISDEQLPVCGVVSLNVIS
ncbi:MAG: baseplate J/gp47 family protein, partial [Selenomonadaceae bacterium]|nr:baseplate J/gp47 family protein [Selenomonadaceae bacterium]